MLYLYSRRCRRLPLCSIRTTKKRKSDFVKILKRIFLVIAILAVLGAIFYSRVFSCIVIAILLAQLIDYRRIILLSNPFERKIHDSQKKSHYYLSGVSWGITVGRPDITLHNNATDTDLTLAMCECIAEQAFYLLQKRHEVKIFSDDNTSNDYQYLFPHLITISSDGDTSVHSDVAFLPFSVQNSSRDFRNLVSSFFICGSVPCSHIEIPANTKYLFIEFRCYARSLSIPGDTMPVLETECSKVYVSENFTVKVPLELNEAALSDSSWSEVQFIGPSGETIDPFRNIRKSY